MPRVFIGIGSNIDPEENVRSAVRYLAELVEVKAISTFYRTEAEGRPDEAPFYNGVLEVDTDIHPSKLKRSVLRAIEDRLGRVRVEDRYAPRTIDLDLLVYGDLVGRSGELRVPDPQIATRAFLAIPLYELAQDLVLPDSGKSIRAIAESLSLDGMEPLPDYTESLRKELECEPR